MPTAAQKRDHDEVPVLKQLESKTTPQCRGSNFTKNNKNSISKSTLKTKVDNKVSSQKISAKKRLRESIELNKSYINSAVNTQITGTLKCDNNCVTILRKREQIECCKCNKKSNKQKAKMIQTIINKKCSLIDKSCSYYIRMTSCGTQFLDNPSSILKKDGRKSKSNIRIELEENDKFNKLIYQDDNKFRENFNVSRNQFEKPKSVSRQGRRWAISNSYIPIRGPDF